MKFEKISELTTNRLSIYLRCLNELAKDNINTVSSETLAKRYHLNSAQIRKDLAYFGEFGVRGVGYSVQTLRRDLMRILGVDKKQVVAIIGAGRLGTALADYYGFHQSNFEVAALFDTNKNLIGQKIGGIKIFDIEDFAEIAEKDNIELAVIAVPADFAQEVLDRVTRAGIKAVLNFAPISLRVAENVKLNTVDLTTSLESLSYYLSQNTNGESEFRKAA
jgi:redox-sensing transcriptional repressor